MPSGALAVDLFFMMSGFVIAYAYDKKIPTLGLGGFMRLRAIRFYPLYLLGLGFGVLRAMILLRLGTPELTYPGVIIALIAAIMFFPAPILSTLSDGISPLNGPAWSLIFEMWINALYALFFRHLTTRILLFVVVMSAISLTIEASAGHIGGGPHWQNLLAGIARVCYSFPLGVLIYRHHKLIPNIPQYGVALIAFTVLLFMIPGSEYYSLLFITILSPAIVIFGSKLKFNSRFANYCGIMSYCIYAIHEPLLMLSIGAGNRLGISVNALVPLMIIAILVAMPIIDRFYDRPLRRVLSSLNPLQRGKALVDRI